MYQTLNPTPPTDFYSQFTLSDFLISPGICQRTLDFSPVNKVMTCPIVQAWLAHTFIDVHLTLHSLITWGTGTGVEPNVIIAKAPILARV